MDVISAVKSHIDPKRLFHSYIISGASDEGRLTAAKYIAKTAVCSDRDRAPCGYCSHCRKADRDIHPDITVVKKEGDGKELTVDAMRSVRSAAAVLPNEAEKSVYIICDADTMNLSAQNAMLKVFEEPPAHAVFILLAENADRLISTVRSRCEIIMLPPEDNFEPSPEAEKVLKSAVGGNGATLASDIMALEKLTKPEMLNAIVTLRRNGTRLIGEGKLSYEYGNKILTACDDCEKYMAVNVSNGYIVGRMLAAFFG